jgi:hypothetical protein
MLSRSVLKVSTALAISLLLLSSFGTAFAQIPAFGEEWPVPLPPAGYSSWQAVALAAGYTATGPINVGGVAFFTKVLNRLLQEQNPFIFNDQPLYAQITVPAGVAVAWIMGMVEYHPPSYQIRNLLPGFPLYIGTAGSSSNVGPFPRGTADPEGKYAWRIGMMALVCSGGCRWFWSQSIQYYNFKQTACPSGTVWDPSTNACTPQPCPAGQHWDPASNTCVANPPVCTLPCTRLDPGTNTCVSTCTTGQQCENNQCLIPCPPGTQRNPQTNSCDCPSGQRWNPDKNSCESVFEWTWVYLGVVVAIIAIGIVAVFLLTRKKPAPSPGYKPYYPTAPAAPTLKPGAPQAVKPAAHRPIVIARREEEKK